MWMFIGCPEPIEYQSQIAQPSDIQHMVYIDDPGHLQKGYWIDAFEFPNRPNQVPLATVSFTEAQTQCNESGKRLCTAYEWRRACLGEKQFRFGYGDTYEQERCHTSLSISSGHSSMMIAREWLSESGQKQYCQTDGVFDLIGNLEEWVSDDWQGREGSLEGGAWNILDNQTIVRHSIEKCILLDFAVVGLQKHLREQRLVRMRKHE